jgi:eukaryotic-like serine/threonine-protein kinase
MSFQVLNMRVFRSGGYGDLFVGVRSDTKESVVVKYLREAHLLHTRKAFEREVRLLARKFRGIVPLLGWNIAAERPYYIMPLMKGGSLSKHAGKLNATQLRTVARDLAGTLANLHAVNAVHGDFKPDNVLLTEDGQLQVADPLGNGSLLTTLFSENRGGTPGYMAPEIADGGSISRESDVYSYGATLCHLVTGAVPRPSQPLDRSAEGFRIARDICEVITLCCRCDSSARPTMQDVVRLLDGTSWTEIQEDKNRDKAVLTAAGLVVGLIFLGAAFRR